MAFPSNLVVYLVKLYHKEYNNNKKNHWITGVVLARGGLQHAAMTGEACLAPTLTNDC